MYKNGFNPCFDGSVARVCVICKRAYDYDCFNPCFDGSVARVRRSGVLIP